MTRTITLLFVSFLMIGPSIGQTQDANKNAALLKSQPNGCGAGWTVYLVPDSIPVVNCTFKAACDAHDNCYGKCEGRARDPSAPECEYLRCKKGGDLSGSKQCTSSIKFDNLTKQGMARRKACDIAIGSDIRKNNSGKISCRAFASAYEKAVKTFGWEHFSGIDEFPINITQSQEEYETAIRDFFRKGTDAEFSAFEVAPPSFNENLKYVPGKGLVNVP